MSIPDFQTLMLPMLALAVDGEEHSLAEAREKLAERFTLTEEDRDELLPSGRQRRYNNRVAWAKVYLEQAKLLSSPRRAHFVLTDRGRDLLAEGPTKIDVSLLGNDWGQVLFFARTKSGEAKCKKQDLTPLYFPAFSRAVFRSEGSLIRSSFLMGRV
jgi:restriction endonuclease Mrr